MIFGMRYARCSPALLVALALSVTRAGTAQIVSGTLLASLTTGSLAGTTFPVSFSYDASAAPPQGQAYLTLTTFSFTLRGIQFTRNDIFQGGQVILNNGKFENVTASFQVRLPANSPVSNITFGFGGDGSIAYIDLAGSYGSGSFALSAVTGAVNAASFTSGEPLAPGCLAAIFGTGFATIAAPARTIPLPSILEGVSVTIAGIPAPLLYVSPSQINLQIPWGVSAGSADVVVTTNGASLTPLKATIGAVSPGLLSLQSGVGQAIAVNPDGSLATDGSIPGIVTHPAHAGDYLMLFGTGLGAVMPPVADGAVAGNVPRYANATPAVLIGGTAARVVFAGMSPQFAGVNQINVIVPAVSGDSIPVQIESGGIRASDRIVVSVRNP